ncbi:MAG TPA: AgmX/PglI C-terminal domain-containing protein [Gammaproteobacteria bacterium]|nr:AgmX/PglI C-terminal domain-containing protein [Gammaproteobacteria bacterium]
MAGENQPLLAQIDEAQGKLGGLEQDLRAVDGELSGLAAKREQYRLLEGVCTSLETLAERGLGETFWGDDFDSAEAAEHVGRVRARVAEFERQVRSVEDKKRSVLEGITQGSDVLSILEADLRDKHEEEYEQSLEWVVERELGPQREGPKLSWVRGSEEDLRLRKSLTSSLLVAGLAALVLSIVPLPEREATQPEVVPERIVRFIQLDQRKPVPPPRLEEPKQKPKEEPLVADQKAAETPKPTKPAEEPKPVETPRQRAQKAGILAFSESFATIAERRPAARLGADAKLGNDGESNSRGPERAMIASLAPGSSGGINLASFSRAVGGDGGGGGALDGVEVGKVADAIGGSPNGRGAAGQRSGDGALAGRTDEEIQIVFDRYKASLYRLYNRELRNDPTLRGQIVLRLTIEPDGSVSLCKLQSTDMNAPALAEQVVERVKTFAFGAKDVAAITIVYPIDFLPAA